MGSGWEVTTYSLAQKRSADIIGAIKAPCLTPLMGATRRGVHQ